MYFSLIRPILEYADVIWDNCTEYMKDKLEQINYEAARIVAVASQLTSLNILMLETGWKTLRDRRTSHKIILFHQMVNNNAPIYLSNLVPPSHGELHDNCTRNAANLINIHTRTSYYHNSFLTSSVRLWNQLPVDTRNLSLSCLKNHIRKTRPVPKHF